MNRQSKGSQPDRDARRHWPAATPGGGLSLQAARTAGTHLRGPLQTRIDDSPRMHTQRLALQAAFGDAIRPYGDGREGAQPPGQRVAQQQASAPANHGTTAQGQRNASPVAQLNEDGRWWGTVVGGGLGALAGAAAGYTYGALSATANVVTGGVADAVKGYQHGGIGSALAWAGHGALSNAVFGFSSAPAHGASVGMKLGSALGSGIGDWWTGDDKVPEHANVIALRMRKNLEQLSSTTLDDQLEAHPAVNPVAGQIAGNEIPLLNWMYKSLGPGNFEEVSRGGQVRVPYDKRVFNGLVRLGAQKRQSSHYSGLLFASGFTQVVGEQYGTTGVFLPTVLFGKIVDREEKPFMYFQPEGHAFNPSTGWREKLDHVKDAFNYAWYGVQQGPHGESERTDARPITGSEQYRPTYSDKYGYSRAKDLESFAANLLYTSGGSQLMSAVGVTSNEYKVAAMHLLTVAGATTLANTVWKRFSG